MNKEIEILSYIIDELRDCKSKLIDNGSEIQDIFSGYEDLQMDITSMTKGKTFLPDCDIEFPKMFVRDFLMTNTSYSLILDTIKVPEVKNADWTQEVEIALEFDEIDDNNVIAFIDAIDELIKSLEYDL